MKALRAILRFFCPEPFECETTPEDRPFKVCSMRFLPASEKYLAIVQMPGGRFSTALGSGMYWTLLEPEGRTSADFQQSLILRKYQESIRHA